MPASNASSVFVLLVAAFAAPMLAPAQDEQQQAADIDALVAKLVGENLPKAAGNRGFWPTAANQAAAALVKLGDKAVPALKEALDSKDPLQRLNAAYVLTQVDTPAALAAQLGASQNADTAVRALAIEALPVYTSSEAHRAAWAALSDSAREVQTAAMLAYSRRMKDRPSNSQRYLAAQKIAELLKVPELRPTAAWVLGYLDSNVAVRPLIAALDDTRWEVRYQVLSSLAKIGDSQGTQGVLPALRDPDANVRCAAAGALGEFRDLRATPALATALTDAQANVRRHAAAALGKIGDLRAAAPLVALLDDSDDGVRRATAHSLAQIGDRQAVTALIGAMQRYPDDAESMAEALGQLGDSRAIGALGKFLEMHPDSTAAAQALAKIRHPEAVAELARIASTINSLAARRGLRAIAGVGFDFEPPESVAQWWKENREHYLRPLPQPRP